MSFSVFSCACQHGFFQKRNAISCYTLCLAMLLSASSLRSRKMLGRPFLTIRKQLRVLTKPTSLNKQGQPKKSKAIPDSKLSVHSRVPWASLELVSEFTDGSSTLPQLSKAIQNGKGVVFCELNEMESMLQLPSENALAILVPPKADRQRLPTGLTGSGCNIVVIAKQAGVEVLKPCILYQRECLTWRSNCWSWTTCCSHCGIPCVSGLWTRIPCTS